VIEVSGLDRPGLLYELTTAISKLNLNIASAHVSTFGERARDVFYVTDLLGAQISAPTRQCRDQERADPFAGQRAGRGVGPLQTGISEIVRHPLTGHAADMPKSTRMTRTGQSA